VFLWFLYAIQQFAEQKSIEEASSRFTDISVKIINYIRNQNHPNLFLHNNNLLYVDGTNRTVTWMNAIENGYPITPRTGYVVEINALWYNALKFVSQLQRVAGNEQAADLLDYQAENARLSFVDVFWTGSYLYDYVVDNYKNVEVRPNMIFAVGLPFSPLSKQQKKSIVDITTRELLTPKGLRTLSPKSGFYRPEYRGGMQERNWNYHNGPVWPWTIGVYSRAYRSVYKESGRSFIERMLVGLEAEMTEICVGTLSELYDGNPPFRGHGGTSYAMSVAGALDVLNLLQRSEKEVQS
jgi:predicted glycogen debranching enzyme